MVILDNGFVKRGNEKKCYLVHKSKQLEYVDESVNLQKVNQVYLSDGNIHEIDLYTKDGKIYSWFYDEVKQAIEDYSILKTMLKVKDDIEIRIRGVLC